MFQPFHAFAGGYHPAQRSRHKVSGRDPFRERNDQPCHGTDARRGHRPMGRQSGTRRNVSLILHCSFLVVHFITKSVKLRKLEKNAKEQEENKYKNVEARAA